MRFLFIMLLCLVGLSGESFAQSKLDSLKRETETIKSDSLKVQAYIGLILEYNRLNFDSALKYANKAEKLSKENGSKLLLARSKYRKATVYINSNQEELAQLEIDSTIQLSTLAGDSIILLSAKIDQGKLRQNNSDYDQAVIDFFDALLLAEKLDNKNAQARIKNYLASIYHHQLQYDLSIRYYKKALKLVRELNFKPGISAVLTNLGESYLSVKNYDSALSYQRQALEIKKELEDKLGMGRVYNNLANVFIYSKSFDLDSGLFYFNKGLQIGREMKDSQQNALSLYGLLRAYYIEGNLDKAKPIAEELLSTLDSLQDLSLASDSYDHISLLYASLGNMNKALQFRTMRNVLLDSLLSDQRTKISQEIEAKYQNEQKAKEIALLESENQLQSLQIEKRENERNYLIAFAIVALILIGLVYNQYRIKQKANNKLRELDHIKTSFFENLSHEFRTPLSLIMVPIREKMAAADLKDKKVYQMILSNAEKLLNQINGLLDLAKLEAGGFKLNKSSVEINKFFNTVVASFSSYASSKSIAFYAKLPEEKQWLLMDSSVLSQLCNNLLSNAFKFTKEGGEVHFEVNYQAGMLTISVKDNGVGIAKDLQGRVFNRFEQLDQPSVFRQGTGIGLSLVKELTEVQGGSITLNSAPGEGSTFVLVLPVEEGLPQPEAIAEEFKTVALVDNRTESDENSYASNQRKILLIEDSVELRNYVSDLLTESYQVITASDGKDGLKQATDEVPDLVISDVMMPEMDGIEFCKRLGEQVETDHIPVILLSARADQQTKISGLRKGAIQYMTKPFEPEELKITIENIIHQQARLWEKYTNNENERITKSEVHPFIKKCEDIVHAHIDDSDFDMTQFAKEVGMSRMQLHRKLVSLTNMSSTAFIRYYRLNKAKELIASGEHVSQVAYAVGFSSLSYFSTSFKKQFGMSPSESAIS